MSLVGATSSSVPVASWAPLAVTVTSCYHGPTSESLEGCVGIEEGSSICVCVGVVSDCT